MSFQQVYYTSCEKGLGGGKGFQVNAASEEITPTTLQQVERLGLYVPPLSAPSRPTPEEIEQFPVSLLFQTLNDGGAVLGQAKYIGADYTGRYGNFFTHSLVSSNPYADFFQTNPILPIETWRSTTWATSENDSTVLSAAEQIKSGEIDFANVLDFLRNPVRRDIFPQFLTAVIEALKTGRRIIIVDDNDNIASWIAAASYCLPYHLTLKLTFNTYVRDPNQSEALITGTTEDTTFGFAPHEIEHQFFVFDFKGERFTSLKQTNGFALKAAFACQHDYAVADFAFFIEKTAPDLTVEELEDAFSTFCYFENLNLPNVNDVRVLAWSAKQLENLADKDFRILLQKVMGKNRVEAEILRAATGFYLATFNASLNNVNRIQIEDLYLQWLIADTIPLAGISALEETAEKLPGKIHNSGNVERLSGEWLKNLKDTQDATRFVAALKIGNKLGLAQNENPLFHWLGKNVVGKWLLESNIQPMLKELAIQPGGKNLLEGVAAFLVERIDEVLFFSSLSTLIEDSNSLGVLTDYAVQTQNLPLYLRLVGTKANDTTKRVETFNTLLTDIKKKFNPEITPEISDAAFNAIWLNQTPTLSEAIELLSPPLAAIVKNSEIPRRLVNVFDPKVTTFTNPQEIKLLDRLRFKEVFDNLGETAVLVNGYSIAAEMQHNFKDIDGTRIEEFLKWLAKSSLRIPQLAPRLYGSLGQKLAKVKKEQAHTRLLLDMLKKGNSSFLDGYALEINKILRVSNNHLEIARLIKVWLDAASENSSLMSNHLLNWFNLLLKNQSKRDLENIDKVLEKALDSNTYETWLSLKDHINEQQKGFLGRMFGNLFSRR